MSVEAVEVKIGGSFTLVDANGKAVTDADFRGRFMLVYFGYTFCPDLCPTSLQSMAQAITLLGDKGAKVVPVFITIDPERDTPEHMKSYVAAFGPSMVGLSGTKEQTAAAASAYRVYFARVEGENGTPYLMDHSSIIYLMGPNGKFVTHFGHGVTPEAMAEKIRTYL
ncbi:MAG: SCO family protein [Alphaproteobacteria bacterium]|nr:SCO family protein [Alphaproteobacteria bacterium]